MATTYFDVSGRPRFCRPSVEIRSREYPGECATFTYAQLRELSVEALEKKATDPGACPVWWCPGETTRAALRDGIRRAKALVLAAEAV